MRAPFEAWKNPAVLDATARRFYRADLEYHDYPHAIDSANVAVGIAEQAVPEGAEIEIEVLPSAGRWHDAGKHLKPGVGHPFPTSETYAAHVSAELLRKVGMPEPLIDIHGKVIESSNPTANCTNDTERCFRQADLIVGGILSVPVVFLNTTYRIYKEEQKLKGEPPVHPSRRTRLTNALVDFGGNSYELLSGMLGEDLALGDHQRDEEGDSIFNREAMRRVNLLIPKTFTRMLDAYYTDIVNYQPVPFTNQAAS